MFISVATNDVGKAHYVSIMLTVIFFRYCKDGEETINCVLYPDTL